MLQQKASYPVYLKLFIAEVVYGCWPLVARAAINEGLDPVIFVLYRCAGAAVLLLMISFAVEDPVTRIFEDSARKQKFCSAAGDPISSTSNFAEAAGAAVGSRNSSVFLRYVDFFYSLPWSLLGILGALICMNAIGYVVGIALTSSSQAALCQPLVPVVACLTSVAAGTETLHRGKLLGVLISVAGAMFVVYAGQSEAEARGVHSGRMYQLGTLGLMVGVFAAALFAVLQKMALRALPPIFLVGMSTLVGSGYLAVFVPLYSRGLNHGVWWSVALTPTREAALAYGIVLATCLNLIIMATANQATNPSIVTSFSTLQPLIAMGVSFAWYGVYPDQRMLVGGVAIILGLLVAVSAQLQEYPYNGETLCFAHTLDERTKLLKRGSERMPRNSEEQLQFA